MVYRPPFIKQLDGSALGGSNCTVASSCMAAIRHLRGINPAGAAQWYPTPKYVRAKMGDTSGGTNLAQNDSVFYTLYKINFDVRYNLPWSTFVSEIKRGRGAVLQGRYLAFKGTKLWATDSFTGNHAVYINEVRYNSTLKRNEFLMYDPLADGRRNFYQGPTWVAESLLKKFAGSLVLNNRTGAVVGLGKCYVMFTRDTEPEVVLRYGGTAYAKTVFAKVSGARVRATPNVGTTKIVRTLALNAPFAARQRTAAGALVNGSKVWYGDATGTQWVHSSVVKFST